ncbi:stretch-activated Ca2+-permeable channel component-domain-containing protein [Sporodiniella umbellata]|nr:stretch-activated Ca2+-permeable channel component-domain-containing protein [Sporodiniella umbellata]
MFVFSCFVILLICISPILCQTTQLQNNQIKSASLSSDAGYQYYYFSIPAQTQLSSSTPNIYLTIASCNVLGLSAYLSTSSNVTMPQNRILLNNTNGLISWNSNHSTSEIWVTVSTNQTTSGMYEIGASTQRSVHLMYNSTDSTVPSVTLDDTDANNALFLTNSLNGNLPNNTLIITSDQPDELSRSICAAKMNTVSNINLNQTMTTRGPTNDTRYQLFVSGLAEASSYKAYLLHTTEGITGMTEPFTFYTKAGSVCRLVHDLTFCNQVAYSVASNPNIDRWSLAAQYDTQAQALFEPFATSLSQFNCESTQYSLVRNCTDCHRDYKSWLCAVTIPRCTDNSTLSQDHKLRSAPAAPAIRNIPVNGSRNPWVDSALSPGESTELLPCIDLCYHVVQSCPPYLQFHCPAGDLVSNQYGYWQTGKTVVNNIAYQFDANHPTCNRMGVDAKLLTIANNGHSIKRISFFYCFILAIFFCMK